MAVVADKAASKVGGGGRSDWRWKLIAAGIVVVVIIAGLIALHVRSNSIENKRHGEAVAAARVAALNFVNLDYRTFSRDTARVLAGSTGQFKQEYANGIKQLSTLVNTDKAISKGSIVDAGFVSGHGNNARVVVSADSEITNESLAAPTIRHYRLQIDLVRQNGQWLVSGMQFVG